MKNSTGWPIVAGLLKKQLFGVLGTSRRGHAYTSLVAFAANDDADCIYFATTRATRKYHNLTEDERVALLIDNRADQSMALYEAAAITAYGAAKEVARSEQEAASSIYSTKHPQLKAFIAAPTTALFKITVEEYHLVQRFQNVTEFRMKKCIT